MSQYIAPPGPIAASGLVGYLLQRGQRKNRTRPGLFRSRCLNGATNGPIAKRATEQICQEEDEALGGTTRESTTPRKGGTGGD